ncbi:MAG TPA: Trp family transcriptional regulator [Candidatus Paceibacterota bacterium]
MKVKPRKVQKRDKIRYLDALYTSVSLIKGREEVKNFLRDLLTESERIMLGRRIIIAQKLLQEESYEQIARDLHVGTDTINRVHRWLADEASGYEQVVKKLEKELNTRQAKADSKYIDPFSFKGLRKRYPLHFFLLNLFGKEK